MKAFPRQITFNNGISQGKWIDDGMDLRDYFAAKAMQGLLTHGKLYLSDQADSMACGDWDDYVVCMAYCIADSMMKERK
jgi:hypothetical protein